MSDLSSIPDLGSTVDGQALGLEPDVSIFKRIVGYSGWIITFFLLLVFFTILKLPEDRLVKFINGTISAQLADQGITFTATESHLSILRMRYAMKDVTLTFPAGDAVRLDSVVVSPSLVGMITGSPGGTLWLESGKGTVDAKFSLGKTAFTANYAINDIDLGKSGILKAAAGVAGGARVSGQGELSGEMNSPATYTGKLGLAMNAITVDSQSIMGFPVPKLTVSEGKADITFDKGRAVLNTLRLGKPGNTADDVRINLTGDVTLGRTWPLSQMNLKSELNLSAEVLKSLSLLDMLLGQGKQADGSYAFMLNGPLSSPAATPIAK